MKKILLASTMLVGSAGIAAADVAISGDAGIGVIYNGGAWVFQYDAGVTFTMTGETDGGLMFGASTGISSSVSGSTSGTSISAPTVWVSHDTFGTLSVGSVDNAIIDVLGGLSDVGYNGLGVDNIAELHASGSPADILYTNTFGDFSIGASFDTPSGDYALAAKYDFNDYYVGIGYDQNTTAAGWNTYHVKAGATFGDFGVNMLYSNAFNAPVPFQSYGIDASYTTGAVTITGVYAVMTSSFGTSTGGGLGVAYDLGGGASLQAGIASFNGTGTGTASAGGYSDVTLAGATVQGNMVASFGIEMSF